MCVPRLRCICEQTLHKNTPKLYEAYSMSKMRLKKMLMIYLGKLNSVGGKNQNMIVVLLTNFQDSMIIDYSEF
jgi:hypothetical protein